MKTRCLTIMATRGQDQELVAGVAEEQGLSAADVEHSDIRGVVPSFGWHPWFSHLLFDDEEHQDDNQVEDGESLRLSEEGKIEHYMATLDPAPTDHAFLTSLPEPRSLSSLILDTSKHFAAYPLALLGEVGLDKAFRIPESWLPADAEQRDDGLTPGGREGRRLSPYRVSLAHQKKILLAQLKLAGRMQRAVSVHGVQAHGHLYDTLQQTWAGQEREVESKRVRRKKDKRLSEAQEVPDVDDGDATSSLAETRDANPGVHSFPPRICLHSYSGPPDTIKQYLHPSVPVRFFFSFSIVINFSSSASSKTEQCIRALPDDCILIESDLHIAGKQMDENLKAVALKICELKGWGVEEGVKQLGRNWKAFVFGDEYTATLEEQNASTT